MPFSLKLFHGFRLLKYFLYSFPIRLYRVPKQLYRLVFSIVSTKHYLVIIEEFCGLLMLIIDLSALPEVYDFVNVLIKKNVRRLTPKEYNILNLILPDTLNEKLIVIDENAALTAQKFNATYVSFFTINSFGNLSDKTFAHELIHIWQYSRFGSIYIVKALFAQKFGEGYDYGGMKELFSSYGNKKDFNEFNFEQQGDILADYFELLQNRKSISPEQFSYQKKVFRFFINQIINKSVYHW